MGDDNRRRKILRRCMKKAGYGTSPEAARGKKIHGGAGRTAQIMLSPSEMVGEVSKQVERRGFVLHEYQIVGVWIIRDRDRDRSGTGGTVMHPWVTTNYYGIIKWAVYPENEPSNPRFFKPDERDRAVDAALRIARKHEVGRSETSRQGIPLESKSGLPQMRISDPIQWDNSEWVVTEHGAIYPWQYGHLGNVPIYVRKNGRWVSYFNRKKIVSLPDVFEQEYLKTKREGGGLHKMTLTMEELQNELNRFTGTENYYRHFTGGKFTDGVKHLADRAGAYWLIDAIFSYQIKRKIRDLPFQIWTLKVLSSELGKGKTEPMAVLEMKEDTDAPIQVSQKIPFTDFPEGEVKLYLIGGVLLLPSEY